MAFSVLFAGTYFISWLTIKGFTKGMNVGRAEGGMDFVTSLRGVFAVLQRLTAVLVLPFGWPDWLVQLCLTLSRLVAFDFPGLAAPECQQPYTAAELQRTRLMVAFVALPVVWVMILFELFFVRHCTKLGKRKAQRGVVVFQCDLLGFGKWFDCEEGAFQHVVVTMHGLLFLSVCQQAVGALVCTDVEAPDNWDQSPEYARQVEKRGPLAMTTRRAMAINPAVYCEYQGDGLPNGWSDEDANIYFQIQTLAYAMIFLFCFVMSFLHWSVKSEYVQIWNKLLVVIISNYWSAGDDQFKALVRAAAPTLRSLPVLCSSKERSCARD
jgi:hypothetical protein